jgi:hypothetical protein
VLILATLGNARPVHAEEAGALTFSWQAPSGCPSRDDLRAEIARLLGGEIRVPKGGDIKAVAVVAPGQTWSLAIETELAGQPGGGPSRPLLARTWLMPRLSSSR